MAFIRTEQTDRLVRAFLSLETEEEGYRFLEDVCTFKEIYAIAQRLEVARDNIGVRPALYLALDRYDIAGGDGTRENPWVIVPRGQKTAE